MEGYQGQYFYRATNVKKNTKITDCYVDLQGQPKLFIEQESHLVPSIQ
jgi:hypothetical protein